MKFKRKINNIPVDVRHFFAPSDTVFNAYKNIETNVPKPTRTEMLIMEEMIKARIANHFFYQYSIKGYYIDFYCPKKRLAIEIDGKYHKNQHQQQADALREYNIRYNDKFKSDNKVEFLRFTDNEVLKDIHSVITKIIETANSIPDYY